jgi:hypothetical protein
MPYLIRRLFFVDFNIGSRLFTKYEFVSENIACRTAKLTLWQPSFPLKKSHPSADNFACKPEIQHLQWNMLVQSC